MDKIALEKEIIATLGIYLNQCIIDDEDRWITRELLHKLMKQYDITNP